MVWSSWHTAERNGFLHHHLCLSTLDWVLSLFLLLFCFVALSVCGSEPKLTGLQTLLAHNGQDALSWKTSPAIESKTPVSWTQPSVPAALSEGAAPAHGGEKTPVVKVYLFGPPSTELATRSEGLGQDQALREKGSTQVSHRQDLFTVGTIQSFLQQGHRTEDSEPLQQDRFIEGNERSFIRDDVYAKIFENSFNKQDLHLREVGLHEGNPQTTENEQISHKQDWHTNENEQSSLPWDIQVKEIDSDQGNPHTNRNEQISNQKEFSEGVESRQKDTYTKGTKQSSYQQDSRAKEYDQRTGKIDANSERAEFIRQDSRITSNGKRLYQSALYTEGIASHQQDYDKQRNGHSSHQVLTTEYNDRGPSTADNLMGVTEGGLMSDESTERKRPKTMESLVNEANKMGVEEPPMEGKSLETESWLISHIPMKKYPWLKAPQVSQPHTAGNRLLSERLNLQTETLGLEEKRPEILGTLTSHGLMQKNLGSQLLRNVPTTHAKIGGSPKKKYTKKGQRSKTSLALAEQSSQIHTPSLTLLELVSKLARIRRPTVEQRRSRQGLTLSDHGWRPAIVSRTNSESVRVTAIMNNHSSSAVLQDMKTHVEPSRNSEPTSFMVKETGLFIARNSEPSHDPTEKALGQSPQAHYRQSPEGTAERKSQVRTVIPAHIAERSGFPKGNAGQTEFLSDSADTGSNLWWQDSQETKVILMVGQIDDAKENQERSAPKQSSLLSKHPCQGAGLSRIISSLCQVKGKGGRFKRTLERFLTSAIPSLELDTKNAEIEQNQSSITDHSGSSPSDWSELSPSDKSGTSPIDQDAGATESNQSKSVVEARLEPGADVKRKLSGVPETSLAKNFPWSSRLGSSGAAFHQIGSMQQNNQSSSGSQDDSEDARAGMMSSRLGQKGKLIGWISEEGSVPSEIDLPPANDPPLNDSRSNDSQTEAYRSDRSNNLAPNPGKGDSENIGKPEDDSLEEAQDNRSSFSGKREGDYLGSLPRNSTRLKPIPDDESTWVKKDGVESYRIASSQEATKSLSEKEMAIIAGSMTAIIGTLIILSVFFRLKGQRSDAANEQGGSSGHGSVSSGRVESRTTTRQNSNSSVSSRPVEERTTTRQ